MSNLISRSQAGARKNHICPTYLIFAYSNHWNWLVPGLPDYHKLLSQSKLWENYWTIFSLVFIVRVMHFSINIV